MRRAIPPLLLAILLAGCLDAADEPGPGKGGALDEEGPFLAYQASAMDAERAQWWVFAVRPNGTAERLQYVDDHGAAIRVGEGIDYPLEDARLLLEPRGGNQNRSAGGVVVTLERGAVEPAAMARLRAALAEWPSTPGGSLDDPGSDDFVRFRADGGVDVLRVPPARPEHRALLEAFRLAQEGFRVEDRFTSTEARPPSPPLEDACPRIRVKTDREAFTPGETLTVTATLENCGAAPLALGQDACGPEPVWRLDVALPGRVRELPRGEAAGAARMPSLACEGAPRPLAVAPGGEATLVARWNGTFTECSVDGACRDEDAPGGSVSLLSYLSRQEHPAQTMVSVVPRGGERTRLLLVKEYDWSNGTADEPLMGYFGPHCAPVGYTLSPPSVTFRVYEGSSFTLRNATLVRDWRDGGHPGSVVTVSADRLDVAWVEGNLSLASPFDPDMPIAQVRKDAEGFLVNGTRVPQGGTHTLRSDATLAKKGGAYEVASILVFRDVGPAAVVEQRVGGCM